MKKEILFGAMLISIFLLSGIALAAGGKILLSKDPAALLIAVGNDYAAQEEDDKAIVAFQKALEYDPSNAVASHNLGVLYYENEDIVGAEEMFLQSINSDSSYAKAHYSLALLHYGNKNYENAIAELEQVIEVEPQNANAYFDLGVIHVERFRQKEDAGTVRVEDLDDLRAGLLAYDKAAEIDPSFPHTESNAKIVESVLNEYSAVG